MLKITQTLETDVLVVGGGIGGLMAAIGAAKTGARVIVAEKANTKRSGSGATGNDHFLVYDPALHGNDMEVIVNEVLDSLVGLCHDTYLTRKFLKHTLSVANLWEEWGIDMSPSGKRECMGHAYPDRPRIWLKYDGHNQKQVLTKVAKENGAEILNHHPVIDLIKYDGKIAGALALNLSNEAEPTVTLIKAHAVVLSTGTANRLYTPIGTPASLFNTAFCPSCTGAAQAQAWRIGAKLVNLEFPNRHAGPKYLARCGKSTWIGLYKYPDGKLLGPFVTKPTKELGDITADVWNTAFSDVIRNGSGPSYLDCSRTALEDLEYMYKGMKSEGLTSVLEYMKRKGLSPEKHAFEFTPYEPHLIGRGLEIDENGETSIPGLYAAGDMVGNFRADIAGAAVWGWLGGQHAGERAKKANHPDIEKSVWVEERLHFYSSFQEKKTYSADWIEANKALQQLTADYVAAGPYRVRSETLLKAGLKYLGDLRKDAAESIYTPCGHTLMRAIETFDLMDCAEVVMHAARERKETRGMHIRSDFTFTNPLLAKKFLTVHQENGKLCLNWRDKRSV